MHRIRLEPNAAAADALREAASLIADGRVVAFPTDTLYGLAVDPYNPDAVERLFAIKGRAPGQAIALVAADREQVETWLGELSPAAKRLANRFWPGPLTIIVQPKKTIDTDLVESMERNETRLSVGSAGFVFDKQRLAPGITAADGTVGVRVPDHAIARGLCRAAGRPLTATSANLSGQPATADPEDVAGALAGRVDLLLDAGRTAGGPPSTLVDAASLRLVRAGAIGWETIQACVRGE